MSDYQQKYEAAKLVIKELDAKVQKYESQDIDLLVQTLDKYESIGTPSQIRAKLESAKTNPKNESSDPDERDERIKELEEQLAAYQELGTIEEVEELMDAYKNSKEDQADLEEKLESYQELGTVSEMNQLITSYSEMKTKVESERIAEELNIDVSKVTTIIDKFESVAEAEATLRELFGDQTHRYNEKHESDKREEKVVRRRSKNESSNELTRLSKILMNI